MKTRNEIRQLVQFPARQSGVALLVAMMALLAGSAFFLVNGHRSEKQNNRLESLLAAKQALIAYAVNYADNYGHNTRGGTGRLPCPALLRHSTPARSCGINAIGFLPTVWMRNSRLMEIDYLERFLGQNIWYAVSADHRFNPAFNPLNSYRGSQLLTVDSMQDVVAVLVAPGQPIGAQNRNASSVLPAASVISEFLEGENADIDSEYTVSGQNDIVVAIRRAELLPLMERRVLGHVKEWLLEYKKTHGFYPYAASADGGGECVPGSARGMLPSEAGTCGEVAFSDEHYSNIPQGRSLRKTWFHRYDWPGLVYYIVDKTCLPDRGVTDCDGINDPNRELTVDGQEVEVILVSVGPPIKTIPAAGMQVRGTGDLVNYLDTSALLTNGVEFHTPTLSALSNDQLVYIN